MIRDILAQLFIEGTPAVFSQSLSFSFLLLRKDHLCLLRIHLWEGCLWCSWIIDIIHYSHYISLWLGNPWPKEPPIKAACGHEVRQLVGLGERPTKGRTLGAGGQNRPLNPLSAWVVPSSCGGDRVSGGSRSRGGEFCSLDRIGSRLGRRSQAQWRLPQRWVYWALGACSVLYDAVRYL